MDNNHNEFTKEEILSTNRCAAEEKTTPLELALLIYPLLVDYFCGIFIKNTKGVLMKMENGQVFQLSFKEVA